MLPRKRRETYVVPYGIRHRRPVVGQRHGGSRWFCGREVVAPSPARVAHTSIAGLVARLPGDGFGMLERSDAVGHLIGAVRVPRVVHGHPEDLAHGGERSAVERFAD